MITYVQTTTIVNAIMHAMNVISSVVAKADSIPGPDGLNDSLSNLLNLLLPDVNDEKDRDAERAKALMQEEIAKGPFKVEGMSYNKPKRKR
jgi:hypothetical protein